MSDLLTLENLANLGVLIFLQAVLGFDNLLYISIESARAPVDQRAAVRRWGIVIAVALRLVMLLVMLRLLDSLTEPFFAVSIPGVIEGSFDFATLVFLGGGAFIMYTAVREISHLLSMEHLEHAPDRERTPKPAAAVVAMIVLMNLVFSFDSIVSAIAITEVYAILSAAILISGLGMLLLADRVADFIRRNRQYEVLGLFILLIVGVVLLGEGGHQAHLTLAGYKVEPLSKTTFYFSVAVLVAVDMMQSRYQKRLDAERARKQARFD
ncbi:TerC family protein [Oceanicella actignis]|uniref:Membrane protein TerC, possibly involved in tellurium resistance n=1 Tax=Oceanicella actignis TaxID=1189325 RepID=A0A1M7SG39_9RHOB|nr:tellurium resistance protein TerC [Oceanicella actignis]TYO91281.1 putative tellurium resistance membrane protein TerC [Oceanicella actignis]SET21577.1 Membrane protein TerC, possibly involved in tellurium resistance [Oceanicella actignis]SHN57443.1 Membrane protein TerC, possibly involved in tellurium resistance [Oceanicella actignis]